MSRVPSEDETRLKTTAAALILALEAKITGSPLRFTRSLRLYGSNTGGWCTVIGTMGAELPTLQVWLDRMSGGDNRHFWFGFNASKLTLVAKAIECYRDRSLRQIEKGDVVKGAGGHYSLKKPLTEAEATKPIPELYYDESEFYFGIFDLAGSSGDIQRAARFVVPIVRCLLKRNSSQVRSGRYGFINRLIRDRQKNFRNAILQAYGNACALTGCRIEECLEAAHLDRFADSCDNSVANGVLLRADLHRLLDAGLMTFVWSDGRIKAKISGSVKKKGVVIWTTRP